MLKGSVHNGSSFEVFRVLLIDSESSTAWLPLLLSSTFKTNASSFILIYFSIFVLECSKWYILIISLRPSIDKSGKSSKTFQGAETLLQVYDYFERHGAYKWVKSLIKIPYSGIVRSCW